MKVRPTQLDVHVGVVQSIKDHAKREQAKGNYEAVGFVAAQQGSKRAVATLPLNNHAADPQHAFFVEPWEQFRAEQKLEKQDYRIVGVYHSHPNSEALPSESDHKLARPEEFVFIYSVVFDDLKAYVEEDGNLIPAEMELCEE